MPWVRVPISKEDVQSVNQDRRKARFLVNERDDSAVAEYLRYKGWNALHAREVGLGGHSDEDILAFAHRENRILLTHDPDFLGKRAFPPHAGEKKRPLGYRQRR